MPWLPSLGTFSWSTLCRCSFCHKTTLSAFTSHPSRTLLPLLNRWTKVESTWKKVDNNLLVYRSFSIIDLCLIYVRSRPTAEWPPKTITGEYSSLVPQRGFVLSYLKLNHAVVTAPDVFVDYPRRWRFFVFPFFFCFYAPAARWLSCKVLPCRFRSLV